MNRDFVGLIELEWTRVFVLKRIDDCVLDNVYFIT